MDILWTWESRLFIHEEDWSVSGKDAQKKEKKVCEEIVMIFHYDCIFNNIPRKKNFLNHSVNESKKISWLGKIAFIYFNGHYCMKKKKAFLAKSESKGYWRYQVLLIVSDIYIYMVVMESFIVMSVYGLQIVVNVIKSLSDVHPYLSQILVLKWSVSQQRYLCIYRYTSLFNFLFHICCKQMQR